MVCVQIDSFQIAIFPPIEDKSFISTKCYFLYIFTRNFVKSSDVTNYIYSSFEEFGKASISVLQPTLYLTFYRILIVRITIRPKTT